MYTKEEHIADFKAFIETVRKFYNENSIIEPISIDIIKQIKLIDNEKTSVFIDVYCDDYYYISYDGYYIREEDGVRLTHQMTSEELEEIEAIYNI